MALRFLSNIVAGAGDAEGAPLKLYSTTGIVAAAAVAVAGVSGTIALIGWAAEIDALKSVAPGLSTMKANTAICFVLTAAALALFAFGRSEAQMRAGRIAALVSAAVGLVTLFEYAAGVDIGIDRLIFAATDEGGRTVPGRMSPPTAFSFVMFGIALALPRGATPAGNRVFLVASHLGVALPVLAAVGYLFGMRALYAPTAFSSMAVHTAISFAALFAGMAAARARTGWTALLSDEGPAGTLARRLLPSVVILPLALGWLVLAGVRAELYGPPSAVAILAVTSMTLLTGFIWAALLRVRSLDAKRRQQEMLNKTVLDTAFDAFVLIDREGRVTEWNPQAEAIFGWRREEALGRDAGELMVPEAMRPMFRAGLASYLATGNGPMLRRRNEVHAIRRDGKTFPADLIVTPIQAGKEVMFSGFVRDVSEQRRTEEQLRQAQKMEAVGQLTGGIAHDFNNLLTVIIGRLDLVADKVDAALRESIQQALTAAERGAGLVKQLLAVSRRQTLAPRTIDINDLAKGMRDLLTRSLGEDVELTMRLDDGLWPAHADPSRVEDALLNLAINARDAMPKGGRLVIETGNVILDAAYCARNDEVAPGSYVMLAVADTGVGMAPDVVRRALEPFFTTKEVGKGTGLGLSMVYGFAKQSRGHLKIYSEPGHGTTVRLYLPRQPNGSAPVAPPADAVPAAARGGSETILVVEDDAEVRDYVVAMLRDLGYRVMTAANGPEAMELIGGGDTIDVLFTDIVMPGGMTGRDLAAQAIRARPKLRVLFTSGYSRDMVDRDGKFDPAEHFLSKPYRRTELAEKLRGVLDGADIADAVHRIIQSPAR